MYRPLLRVEDQEIRFTKDLTVNTSDPLRDSEERLIDHRCGLSNLLSRPALPFFWCPGTEIHTGRERTKMRSLVSASQNTDHLFVGPWSRFSFTSMPQMSTQGTLGGAMVGCRSRTR